MAGHVGLKDYRFLKMIHGVPIAARVEHADSCHEVLVTDGSGHRELMLSALPGSGHGSILRVVSVGPRKQRARTLVRIGSPVSGTAARAAWGYRRIGQTLAGAPDFPSCDPPAHHKKLARNDNVV